MRVALVTYGMLGGGIETFLLNLGAYLKQSGCEVTIVTTEVPGAWFNRIAEYGLQSLYIQGLDRHSPLVHVDQVADSLYDGQFDAVLLNHDRYAQAALALGSKKPVVVPVLHGNIDFFARMTAYNSQWCHSIITVSPKGAETMRRHSPDCPVRTIINGVPLIADNPKNGRDYQQKGLRLIYTGRIFDRDKGVFLLPEILAQLQQDEIPVTLDVVGDGKDLAELKQRFSDHNLEQQVTFWGFLNSAQTFELMQNAHILLFTTPLNNTEGLPLVIIESQMCGCVPVASLLKNVTDCVIEDATTGFLVTPGDVKQFSDAVKKLYDDRQLLKQMSEAARELARQKLSLEVMGSQYLELLSSKQVEPNELLPPSNKDQIINYLAISPVDGVEDLYRKWIALLEKRQSITECLHGKRVAIFGSLKTALYLVNDCNNAGVEVIAFIDNNKELHGTTLCGIPIMSVDGLKEHFPLIEAILVSLESNEDLKIKAELQRCFEGVAVFTWKELVANFDGAECISYNSNL